MDDSVPNLCVKMLESVGEACYEYYVGLQLGRMSDKAVAVGGSYWLYVGEKLNLGQKVLEHWYILGCVVLLGWLGAYIQLVL